MDLGDVFSARTMRRSALGFGRGAWRGSGRVFKGTNVRSKDCSCESRAVRATRARVLPGHEVGDGSDSWAHLSVSQGRGTRPSAVAARWRGAAAGLRSMGRELGRAEKKEGGGESRPRGERRLGRAQEQRGRESFSFYFLFLFLKQTYFKIFSKPNLNSFSIFIQTTHHNKSNARACMLC